jgi:hypothetical protein
MIAEGTTPGMLRETTKVPEKTLEGKTVPITTAIKGGQETTKIHPPTLHPKNSQNDPVVQDSPPDFRLTTILCKSMTQSVSIRPHRLIRKTHKPPRTEAAARNDEAENEMISHQLATQTLNDLMMHRNPKKISIRMTDQAIFPTHDQSMEKFPLGLKS